MLNRRNGYEYEDLLACARGEMFGPGNAQLPLPPMLMFDRITDINDNGGEFGKGLVRAELDVKPDLWFFGCHFKNDPVMPGCLGLDALWQMVGFYLGWSGGEGRGRALGLNELKFSGQVLPEARKVVYNVDIKRVMRSKLVLGIADGWISVDDRRRINRRRTLHLRTEAELGIFLSPRNARLRLVKARKHFLGVVSDGRDDAHPGDHNPPHDSLAYIVVFLVMRVSPGSCPA